MTLFFTLSSLTTRRLRFLNESYGTCWVTTITTTNVMTGEQTVETYYSNSRQTEAECAAGRDALLAGDFMRTSDFRKSPVLTPN